MKTKQFSVEISDDAEIDFDKSYKYYSADSLEIADTFFKQINFSLENIQQTPYSFSKIHKNIRKYIVKKFPFVIYFQVIDTLIKVIAIFHTSRNPEIWNDRI